MEHARHLRARDATRHQEPPETAYVSSATAYIRSNSPSPSFSLFLVVCHAAGRASCLGVDGHQKRQRRGEREENGKEEKGKGDRMALSNPVNKPITGRLQSARAHDMHAGKEAQSRGRHMAGLRGSAAGKQRLDEAVRNHERKERQ